MNIILADTSCGGALTAGKTFVSVTASDLKNQQMCYWKIDVVYLILIIDTNKYISRHQQERRYKSKSRTLTCRVMKFGIVLAM
jgi:hypothetical protein